jgi:hypothetical protein
MAVNLSPVGGVAAQFFNNDGTVLSGGKIYTYLAGTNTPATTYTTSNGSIAHTNPIILDSAGRVPGGEMWLTVNIVFKFVLKTSNEVLIGTYDNVTSALNTEASRVSYTPVGTGAEVTTVQAKLEEFVSVQDFGAYGDGSGITPTDTGDNILTASWNTWDNTPWKDDPSWSPFYANMAGTFQPPRVQPFANDDTWDYIGCNLALWEGARREQKTYFPAGVYVMNAYSTTPKGGYQGLSLMKGMEQVICGAGPYETIIEWKEDAAFFDANNFGSESYYKLLTCYRIGGPPTNVMEMGFVGPSNYNPLALNITLIYCANINGVTFRDLWLSSCYRGIHAQTSSGDSYIKGCTAEFCFGSAIDTDANSDFKIDFCNLTASAAINGQTGVLALGNSVVTNTNFVGMYGPSFTAATGIFANNSVTASSPSACVSFTDTSVISGNNFQASSSSSVLQVTKNASIVGNTFNNSANQPTINLGTGAQSSATNIVISGNTFIKTNAAAQAQNYTIIANESNVGYTGAATQSVIISNNTFQGRSFTSIGKATLINNSFDSSIVAGNINSRGDVSGAKIQTGTDANASFTVNISGLIGQSSGSERDVRRVTIINFYCNATGTSGHESHGVAIYTNDYNGQAKLLGTLGSYAYNGTITFGESGIYPTVTITNTTGNTAVYEVYALPMI